MNHFKVVIHSHSEKSFDATISLKRWCSLISKYQISHIILTEHNNLDSYLRLKEIVNNRNLEVQVIPACEYTTSVGDIIVLFHDKLIEFSDYKDLIHKAKNKGALIALPHPSKRSEYPIDLINNLSLYEILNLRRSSKNNFDNRLFNKIPFFFGSDAHNWIDLPGCINHYYSDKSDLKEILLNEVPIPSIHRLELNILNKISKGISKLKRLK